MCQTSHSNGVQVCSCRLRTGRSQLIGDYHTGPPINTLAIMRCAIIQALAKLDESAQIGPRRVMGRKWGLGQSQVIHIRGQNSGVILDALRPHKYYEQYLAGSFCMP